MSEDLPVLQPDCYLDKACRFTSINIHLKNHSLLQVAIVVMHILLVAPSEILRFLNWVLLSKRGPPKHYRGYSIANEVCCIICIGGSKGGAAGARPLSTQILSFLHTNFPQSCRIGPWRPPRSRRAPSGNPGPATDLCLKYPFSNVPFMENII